MYVNNETFNRKMMQGNLHFANLGEVADYMTPMIVILRHDIKQERFHIKIQSLVVEEQLGQ